MIIFTFVRTIVPIAVGYDRNDIRGSLSLSLWTPVKLAAWTLVLDLAFYSARREDHDLHRALAHRRLRLTSADRYGRAGQSYGKTCAVWDWLFGTMNARVETPESTAFWNRK